MNSLWQKLNGNIDQNRNCSISSKHEHINPNVSRHKPRHFTLKCRQSFPFPFPLILINQCKTPTMMKAVFRKWRHKYLCFKCFHFSYNWFYCRYQPHFMNQLGAIFEATARSRDLSWLNRFLHQKIWCTLIVNGWRGRYNIKYTNYYSCPKVWTLTGDE